MDTYISFLSHLNVLFNKLNYRSSFIGKVGKVETFSKLPVITVTGKYLPWAISNV